MRLPGTPSLVFLVYLLVFLPWAALRSARRLRAAREAATARPLPSREAVWISSLVMLVFLFALAWLTGRSFEFHIFALPALGPREILAAFVALLAYFLIRAVLRDVRPEAQRRKLTVYWIAPRTAREWTLWSFTVLAASVAEEAAYRGVGMSILWFRQPIMPLGARRLDPRHPPWHCRSFVWHDAQNETRALQWG